MTHDQILIDSWLREESTWKEHFRGWDFSSLVSNGRMSFNTSKENLGWDYTEVICQTLEKLIDSSSDNNIDEIYLLDLGTGGGEFLEELLRKLPVKGRKLTVYATESYEPNFLLAKQRLISYGFNVVQSESASLNSFLPFPNDWPKFDLIISRHTCYNIREVDRLLKNETGIFITQQVDGKSNQDLIELFCQQAKWPYFNLSYASDLVNLQAPSMKIVQAQESTTYLAFKDIGALIIYLHAVPWVIENFSVHKYKDILLKLYHTGQKEFVFTSKYMLLKAAKTVKIEDNNVGT